ncbi:Lactonase, 7-bladed beta-propeller-domain-containing protein [Crucibulum laeve]|uniref:Lactonase, 7-bladed beta-propeller-domain-containing protein n=1 Tax=Crucibulum laeve TaxID=68775 RepID=A0A5C3LRH1_9AGAR|nr:Lactonase, 7-bladed beta-propeller-domain-containing protein [Crucibulum laeve]
MAKIFYSLGFLGLSALSVRGQAALYGQCGGIGWSGSTACVSGSACTKLNDYYSQCLPGSASSSAPATTPTSTGTASTPSGTSSAFTILAGGYDTFVATYSFNPNTKSLTLISKSPTGMDPSWITSHPTKKNILYAVNEVASGQLQSFDIDSKGSLSSAIDTISSGGDSPAFAVALSTGQVAIMNYNSGNGRIIPTSSTPEQFSTSASVITFPRLTSGVSHPHMAVEHGSEVLVPDLGGDMIWRLVQDGSPGNFKIQGSIPQPQGSGPRHIAIYNERLYTLHELASTLTVQTIPQAPNGTASIIASASILPPNPPAGAMFAAGEILIPAPTTKFPTPYIYVSNRNTGVQDPRGDSIAIFEHVNQGTSSEGLKLVNQVFTGLDQVRGMEFGPADKNGDQYLIASGVAGSAGVIVLQRTEGGKNMQIIAKNLDIPTRTSFVWL